MNQRVLTVVCMIAIAVGAVGTTRAIGVPFSPGAPTRPRGRRSPQASYLSLLPLPWCLSPVFAPWEFVVRCELVMPAHVNARNIKRRHDGELAGEIRLSECSQGDKAISSQLWAR